MKKSFKQYISFLLAIMLVITLLVGCGTSALPEEPAELAMATPQSFTSITPLQGASPPAAIRDIFPDEGLARTVANSARQGVNSIVTQVDLDQIQGLDLRIYIVGSFEGMQYLRELRHLALWNSQVGDLSPLSGLVNLESLRFNSFGNNFIQVGDLGALSGLTNLRTLSLGNRQVSDLSPLAGLVNLEDLTLTYSQVSDLRPLSGLTNLRRLSLLNSQVSDLSPLSGLVDLETLHLGQNQISDLRPLSGLINLDFLSFGSNQVSDLSPLSGLVNLNNLGLSNNQVRDLRPLSGLVNLHYLSLGNNQISDLSPLSGLVGLGRLSLDQNQIRDLRPLSGLTNLWRLNLSNNQINDLRPLSGLANLWDLILAHNQITDFSPVPPGAWPSESAHPISLGLQWYDQRATLAPMTRAEAETVSIANMVRDHRGELIPPSYISDGGTYENGMITWGELTTQQSASFSWRRHFVSGLTFERSEVSGTVTIPLRPPSPEIIELNRDSIFEFPSRAVGATPSQLITTVRNISNTSPGPLTARLSGANADSFEFRYISCNNLRPHPDHKPVFRDLPNASFFTIPNLAPGEAIEFIMRPRLNLPAGIHTATVTVSGGGGIWESFDVVFEVR